MRQYLTARKLIIQYDKREALLDDSIRNDRHAQQRGPSWIRHSLPLVQRLPRYHSSNVYLSRHLSTGRHSSNFRFGLGLFQALLEKFDL